MFSKRSCTERRQKLLSRILDYWVLEFVSEIGHIFILSMLCFVCEEELTAITGIITSPENVNRCRFLEVLFLVCRTMDKVPDSQGL
jgi:hypothetical protein